MYCDECGKYRHETHLQSRSPGGNICRDCWKEVKEEHEQMVEMLRSIVKKNPNAVKARQLLVKIDHRRDKAKGNGS